MIDPILTDPNMELIGRTDMSMQKESHECEYKFNLAYREATCSCGKGFRILPTNGYFEKGYWVTKRGKFKVKEIIR